MGFFGGRSGVERSRSGVLDMEVFSLFATLSTPFFKQFGVGLAALDPDRRHHHPRCPPARDDEATRRLEPGISRRGWNGCRTYQPKGSSTASRKKGARHPPP
jgi:hypothetical protein